MTHVEQWTVLGSGTIVPHSRACASHLLRIGELGALFDVGSGARSRLARFGPRLGTLSHIFCTHDHLDHWADLLSLLFYRMVAPPEDRYQGLVIAGPSGFEALVNDVAKRIHPEMLCKNEDISWIDISPGQVIDASSFQVRAFEVEHGSRLALAYRVTSTTAHWSLCYSGDTRPCQGILSAAKNVDILICECTFLDGMVRGSHMSPSDVRNLAENAGVQNIVLTHIDPSMNEGNPLEAFEGFQGTVRVAEDGTSVDLLKSSYVAD